MLHYTSLDYTFLKMYTSNIKIDLYLVKLIEHSIIIEIINKHGYSKNILNANCLVWELCSVDL